MWCKKHDPGPWILDRYAKKEVFFFHIQLCTVARRGACPIIPFNSKSNLQMITCKTFNYILHIIGLHIFPLSVLNGSHENYFFLALASMFFF